MPHRSAGHPAGRPVTVALTLVIASLAPALVGAQATNRFGNPQKVAPAPTTPAISVRDLQIRLYQFADDSMMGRQVGHVGNRKGTEMIAAEVKRLGLLPAGDNGTYFQNLPYHVKKFTTSSKLTVNGNPLTWNQDWLAVPGARAPRAIMNAEVIFGGRLGDSTMTITPAQAAGKFVVVLPRAGGAARGPAFGGGRGGAPASPFPDAVAIATIDLDALSPAQRAALNEPTRASLSTPPNARLAAGRNGAPPDTVAYLRALAAELQPQANIRLTTAAAARLFGGTMDGVAPGSKGGSVTASLDFVELPTEWGRNVIAMIPGSDPKLKYQYVAIGAHNDHVGLTTPVDKDSLKAFRDEYNRRLIANGMVSEPKLLEGINVNMDSIRRIHPRARIDSVNNGADDDGSGSMGVLEIAEAIMAMPVKPKRTMLFVWHAGEEAGLLGAQHFTRNPTVPLDSIVAQLNIDMIGRGRAEDLPGGGPDYLGVVGSWFDSKDLGEQVVAANKKQAKALQFDYKYDSTLTWSGYNNIYGRSDHYMYAQQGIPIAFFFTGLHGDYHQRTDEADQIDYPHYARIANYIRDLTIDVANGPRPRLNGTKPTKPRVIVP